MKICKNCNKEYKPNSTIQKYCNKCNYEVNKKQTREAMKRKSAGMIKTWGGYYRQRNKYMAKPKEYKGRQYHSGQEADDAMWLDLMVQDGRLKEVKPQHKIRFEINGKHLWTHIIDFKVTLPDGREKMVETKGFATELWRRNYKLFQALYPDIPYLVNPNEKEVLR